MSEKIVQLNEEIIKGVAGRYRWLHGIAGADGIRVPALLLMRRSGE